MQTFLLRTTRREQFIDITAQVADALLPRDASGLCCVFVPHTTAAVTINENADPSVVRDILHKLAALIPADDGYAHAEGNSDAHLKSSLVGPGLLIPVESGRLALGTWQAVYFCEFDGPRSRRVIVQVQGE